MLRWGDDVRNQLFWHMNKDKEMWNMNVCGDVGQIKNILQCTKLTLTAHLAAVRRNLIVLSAVFHTKVVNICCRLWRQKRYKITLYYPVALSAPGWIVVKFAQSYQIIRHQLTLTLSPNNKLFFNLPAKPWQVSNQEQRGVEIFLTISLL